MVLNAVYINQNCNKSFKYSNCQKQNGPPLKERLHREMEEHKDRRRREKEEHEERRRREEEEHDDRRRRADKEHEDRRRQEAQEYENKERREEELHQKKLAYYDALITALKVFKYIIKEMVKIDYFAK